MKIGIDVRMIQDFPTGIGNYLENLIRALAKLPSEYKFVLVGNSGNKMERWVGDHCRFEFVTIRSRPNSVHQHLLLPLEVSRLGLDLFWTTPWGASIFLWQKYALTIYDLLYRRYPKIASWKARLYEAFFSKWIARRAAVIFTISEFVKNDIVNFLGVKKSKIVNIQGAAGESFKVLKSGHLQGQALQTLERRGITKPFFVYLGNFRPHKNLPTLLRALARMRSEELRMKDVKLVLVGSVDAKGRDRDVQNLLNLLKELKLRESVILTGRIPDDCEVAAILNEAVALVHPSFHEGFGLTVLEAMACGCPVVAANTTSIPEVVGGAGILIDPHNVEDLAEVMRSLRYGYTTKTPEYQVMKRSCLEQAKKFSWERTAEKVLGTIGGTVSNP